MRLKIRVPEVVPFADVEAVLRRAGIDVVVTHEKRRYLSVRASERQLTGDPWDSWKEDGLSVIPDHDYARE